MESTETQTTETKGLKAKAVSLWGKIIGAVIIIGGSALHFSGHLPQGNIDDICKVGFCVMGIFSTIDINILVDKFTKR